MPLVAQLPVFRTLFYVLRHDLRFDICGQTAKACSEVSGGPWGESFLFIPDLTDKATGGVLVALLILYVGTQLASGLVIDPIDPRERRLRFPMPAHDPVSVER